MEQRRRLLGSEGTSSSTTTTLKVSLLESLGQTWSGELVALFVEDWDLARAALSCHLAPDLLCQCKKRVRIALSRSVHRAHCVRSVWKIVSQWSERDKLRFSIR